MGAAAELLFLLLLLLGARPSLLCPAALLLPGRRSCCSRPLLPLLLLQAGARWRPGALHAARAGQPHLGALAARSWGWGRSAADVPSIMLLSAVMV
jgi:hypothetical protein